MSSEDLQRLRQLVRANDADAARVLMREGRRGAASASAVKEARQLLCERGGSLAAMLEARGGALPWEEAAVIGEQLLDMVVEANARGAFRLMVDADDVLLAEASEGHPWLVLDAATPAYPLDGDERSWGRSRSEMRSLLEVTAAETTFDPPPTSPTVTMYGAAPPVHAELMSPEVIRGEGNVDAARQDVFALGVLMYRLIAGRMPFGEGQLIEIVMKIVHGQYTPLLEAAPDTPRAVVACVEKAMAKDAADRFENAAAFRDALLSARLGEETPPVRDGPPSPQGAEGLGARMWRWLFRRGS